MDAALTLIENQGVGVRVFKKDCIRTAIYWAGESKRFSVFKIQEQPNSPVSNPSN